MAAMGKLSCRWALAAVVLAVVGCATAPAPVFEVGRGTAPHQAQRVDGPRADHLRGGVAEVRVERGDTLYGIAFRHGLDWRSLAEWNAIPAPYTIFPGQLLRLGPQQGAAATVAVAAAPPPSSVPPAVTEVPSRLVHRDAQSGVEVYAIDSSLTELPPPPVETVTTVDVGAPPSAVAMATPPVTTATPAQGASGIAGTAPLSGSPAAQRAAQARAERAEAAAVAAVPEPIPPTSTASVALTPPAQPVAPPPAQTVASTPPAAASVTTPAATQTVAGMRWQWPARGDIVRRFAASESGRRGIHIAGRAGDPVVAAADGEVVYTGNGLVGYGELIIIKHSPTLLSAYGHNRVRLVEQGQSVRAGQQIAELGRSGTDRDILHFEIRQNGQPVDPMRFLPAR